MSAVYLWTTTTTTAKKAVAMAKITFSQFVKAVLLMTAFFVIVGLFWRYV